MLTLYLRKTASGIGAINRINHCLPPTALHDVYYGLVQSHFDCCIVVWGNCGKTLRNKLQLLQNRAARSPARSLLHSRF